MTLWRWFKYNQWKLPAKPMKINGHWHAVLYIVTYNYSGFGRHGRGWLWYAAARVRGGACRASSPWPDRHRARRSLHRTISRFEGA